MLEMLLDKHGVYSKGEKDKLLIDVMNTYGQSIHQLTFTYVKDYAMAEDLTQDIFIKFYRKVETFKQESSLKTWLYRIAINHCKDYLKRRYTKKLVLDNGFLINELEIEEGTLVEKIIQKSEEESLIQALLQLPIKYRESVYLFYYEGLSTKQISYMLDINESTIKTRLNRARQLIKCILQKSEEEEFNRMQEE